MPQMLPKRTKQTARKSTGGWAPGGQLSSNPTYFQTLPSAGAGIKRSPGPVDSTSAQRPAKRQVPAPRRSSRIGGTGQSANLAHAFELTALKAQLKLRQDAHDREQVDLNRRQAQLNREAAALHARRVQETRPLKAQIGELQSYFKLVARVGVPDDAALVLAQRRLALAGLLSARMGACALLQIPDLAETIAMQSNEDQKLRMYGPEAAAARAQLRFGVISVEGFPEKLCLANGVYHTVSEHHGYPVLKSSTGRFLFYADGAWKFTMYLPVGRNSRKRFARREADGPLPVGKNEWRAWLRSSEISCSVTTSLITRAVDAQKVELRIREQEAAAIRKKLEGKDLVAVSGFPCEFPMVYNGIYTRLPDHDGWPVFQNADGMYLYHAIGFPTRARPNYNIFAWVLSKKFTPDSHECYARLPDCIGATVPSRETMQYWNGESFQVTTAQFEVGNNMGWNMHFAKNN